MRAPLSQTPPPKSMLLALREGDAARIPVDERPASSRGRGPRWPPPWPRRRRQSRRSSTGRALRLSRAERVAARREGARVVVDGRASGHAVAKATDAAEAVGRVPRAREAPLLARLVDVVRRVPRDARHGRGVAPGRRRRHAGGGVVEQPARAVSVPLAVDDRAGALPPGAGRRRLRRRAPPARCSWLVRDTSFWMAIARDERPCASPLVARPIAKRGLPRRCPRRPRRRRRARRRRRTSRAAHQMATPCCCWRADTAAPSRTNSRITASRPTDWTTPAAPWKEVSALLSGGAPRRERAARVRRARRGGRACAARPTSPR